MRPLITRQTQLHSSGLGAGLGWAALATGGGGGWVN